MNAQPRCKLFFGNLLPAYAEQRKINSLRAMQTGGSMPGLNMEAMKLLAVLVLCQGDTLADTPQETGQSTLHHFFATHSTAGLESRAARQAGSRGQTISSSGRHLDRGWSIAEAGKLISPSNKTPMPHAMSRMASNMPTCRGFSGPDR